ncbi:type II toxin-antitoxin system Phd/YefM family antitoxin [Saccharothrix longispora]|uniref:Antitoxin n=1 Tax=Saccharothrix longispora TaxID=33920 RepID=A0ABU1Q570_9PSEU|nr:type II toxin-antitoxin system Phd/YefM family antitoxin [Saccharothrix longispora]MDR6598036.1 prevent-host-death family protein [Saccharothrix longispora]
MKEISASEASRNFSAVLDEAEEGETIIVTRNGRPAAMIVPAPRANGRAVLDVFRSWHGRPGLDAEFEANVTAARDAVSGELDEDPWRG